MRKRYYIILILFICLTVLNIVIIIEKEGRNDGGKYNNIVFEKLEIKDVVVYPFDYEERMKNFTTEPIRMMMLSQIVEGILLASLTIFPMYLIVTKLISRLGRKYVILFCSVYSIIFIDLVLSHRISFNSEDIILFHRKFIIEDSQVHLQPVGIGTLTVNISYAALVIITGFAFSQKIVADINEINKIFKKIIVVSFLALLFYRMTYFILSNIDDYLVERILRELFQNSIPSFIVTSLDIILGLIAVYLIFTHYEKLNDMFYHAPKIKLVSLIQKNQSTRKDLRNFVILSILITLLAEVMFMAMDEQSIISFIPGFESYVDAFLEGASLTIGDTQSAYGRYLAGPTIGVLVALVLRQFRYREERKMSKKNSKESEEVDYPGARILLLFVMLVSAILLVDGFSYTAAIFPDENGGCDMGWQINNDSNFCEKINDENELGISFIIPELYDKFLILKLTMPTFYAAIVFTWFMDWYVFSRLWKN